MSTPVSINDAKVQAIVSSYTGIEILHPVVSDMCDDPEFKRMFWLCLSHDLEVISQRSQDLADGEVTANQKAFKVLMENEDSEGAVEIYVDEILGLKFSSDAMKAQTLATALQTKDYIMNYVYGTKTPSSEATTEILVVRRNVRNQHRGQANKRSSTASRQRGDDNLFVAEDSDSGMAHRGADLEKDPLVPGHSGVHFVVPSQNDPKMKRLLAMYRHAKGEFNATIPRSLERTTAAKFLRDTTENCLAHIATQQRSASSEKPDLATSMANASFDGFTMEELEDTLKKTTAIAEKGSGGKKRRFDENWDNVPKGPSDKKSQQTDSTTRKADPLPQGRTVGVSTGEVVPLPPGLLGNANRGPHADSRPLEHRAAVMVEDCQRRYAHAEYTRRAPPHLSLSFNRQNMRRPFPKTDEEPGDRDARVRRGRADRYRPSYN